MSALRLMVGLSLVLSLAVGCGGSMTEDMAVPADSQVSAPVHEMKTTCSKGTSTNGQIAAAYCCNSEPGSGGGNPTSSCVSDWCVTQCHSDCGTSDACYVACYGSCRNAVTGCLCAAQATPAAN